MTIDCSHNALFLMAISIITISALTVRQRYSAEMMTIVASADKLMTGASWRKNNGK